MGCQNTLRRIHLHFKRLEQEKESKNDRGGKKERQMKGGSELEGCAFLWLAWLESEGDVLLAVQFIIPKPYGLASFWGVVGYVCVCVDRRRV